VKKLFTLVQFGLALCLIISGGDLARAKWKLLDPRTITAMDFLPTGTGLTGIGGAGTTIEKWDAAGHNGVQITTGTVTSILVIDSTTGWATVKNDGLYRGTKGWTEWNKQLAGNNIRLLLATRSFVFVVDGKTLKFSTDGNSFTNCAGILATDTVAGVDYLDDMNLVAAAGSTVYRTSNGGADWTATSAITAGARSVYIDRFTGLTMVGGDPVLQSKDGAQTWKPCSSLFDSVQGQVVGAHDCSGVFYVAPIYQRGSFLRSQSHAQFFQEAGPANFASIRFMHICTFDRGATMFWLDSSGTLSESTDGVNGTITTNVIQWVTVSADTGITSSICGNGTTTFGIHVNYLDCVPLFVDSITVLRTTGIFNRTGSLGSIANGQVLTINYSYRAKLLGLDSAVLRLWTRSSQSGISEYRDFSVVPRGVSMPAHVMLKTNKLNFGQVKVDSTKQQSLVVYSDGCESLRIDSLVSSNPTLFAIDTKTFPIILKSGDSVKFNVRFTPTAETPYLEALELGTSAGHTFINVAGAGTQTASVGASSVQAQFALFPNPARGFLSIELPDKTSRIREIVVRDVMGRVTMTSSVTTNARVMLDVSALAAGEYIVQVTSNKSATTEAGVVMQVQHVLIIR
jgi:hypothetical protein